MQQDIKKTVLFKVDRFMQNHILPFLNPTNICWWFSLSGGKDSYSMALAVRRWYEERGIAFYGYGFHIIQWSPMTASRMANQIDWLPIKVIDARALTNSYVGYSPGGQAPCRKCADVRRKVTDELITNLGKSEKVNLVARGLHLTDTAISLLWRYLLGAKIPTDYTRSGKGQPIVKLWQGTYLCKPLYYIREYETETYAKSYGFQSTCCGCPACMFPSRRDIIEETILPLVHKPLWEFSIPGLRNLLSEITGYREAQKISANSMPGIETKKAHLPSDFGSFALKYFMQRLSKDALIANRHNFTSEISLDSVGIKRLCEGLPLLNVSKIPIPDMLRPQQYIANEQALMIGALGPFWGAYGLHQGIREKANSLQKLLFDFEVDELWGHTHRIITEYWRIQHDESYGEDRGVHPVFSTYCNSCGS